jgi:predicted lipase
LISQLTKSLTKHPNAPIYFTGHSLGGALASLAAAEFAKKYKLAPVYTFGKPRVGNKKYAEWFNSILTGYRVVHYHDAAPATPPRKNFIKSLFSHYNAARRHELAVIYHESFWNFEY